MWLRNRVTNTFVLFGDSKEVNWSPFDLINNLIYKQTIDELIKYYSKISKDISTLTSNEIKEIKEKIPEVEEELYCIDCKSVLNSLINNMPKNIKIKVQENKDSINDIIEKHIASDLLTMFKKEMK